MSCVKKTVGMPGPYSTGDIDVAISDSENIAFHLSDDAHEYMLGLSAVLGCICYAEADGSIPKLPESWHSLAGECYGAAPGTDNIVYAENVRCENCCERLIFYMPSVHAAFGLITVLSCLSCAVAAGELPQLPQEWCMHVTGAYGIDFPECAVR